MAISSGDRRVWGDGRLVTVAAQRGWRLSVGRRGAVAGLVLAAVFGGIGAGRRADPPGNNGTVKVDGVVFDDHPDNEPHVGCVFQIDWYGFDEGEDLF